MLRLGGIVIYLIVLLVTGILLISLTKDGTNSSWASLFFLWLLLGWIIVIFQKKWRCEKGFAIGSILIILGIIWSFFELIGAELFLKAGLLIVSISIVQAAWECRRSIIAK